MERTNGNVTSGVARIPQRIGGLLARIGVGCKIDERGFLPIGECLRESWYVSKIKQLGYRECLHIRTEGVGGFFAVLDNGDIFSGANLMIWDAFTNIIHECSQGDGMTWLLDRFRFEQKSEGDDSYLLICRMSEFEDFVRMVEENLVERGHGDCEPF